VERRNKKKEGFVDTTAVGEEKVPQDPS